MIKATEAAAAENAAIVWNAQEEHSHCQAFSPLRSAAVGFEFWHVTSIVQQVPMLSNLATWSHNAISAALFACLAGVVPAQALDETVSIQSRAISDEEFLRGEDANAPAITITGQLTGRDSDTPVPLVILLHGTDGPRSGAAGSWRAFLNAKGITTLRLDSYSGRGLENASSNQGSFGQFAQIYDAYRAADALAGDPRIDGSRIVIMGFSRGALLRCILPCRAST